MLRDQVPALLGRPGIVELKLLYATADDGTNPNIVDATSAFITASSTTTLTNKSIDLGDQYFNRLIIRI